MGGSFGQVTQEFVIVPHTAQQSADLLQIPWQGYFDQCGHDIPGSDAHRRAKWSGPEISIRNPQAGLRGGELKVMLAQALEERPHCLDVSRRVGVEDDHIVEVGATCSKPFTTSFITLTNHPGEALLPWGMTSHS